MSEHAERLIDPRADGRFVRALAAAGGHARLLEPHEKAALAEGRPIDPPPVPRTLPARAPERRRPDLTPERERAPIPATNPRPAPVPERTPAMTAASPAPETPPGAPLPIWTPPAASPGPQAAAPSLKPITALTDLKGVVRNPIAPPPKIAWIPVERLMIDEGYQRAIGKRGRQNILRLVGGWDWNCYKPLSVAAIEGREGWYEVVDGQHSAIAAATHGSVEMLPCVVLSAASRADKAKAFLGINRDRVTLTAFALFRARMASGEPLAGEVGAALDGAGVFLVESLQAGTAAERAGVRTAAVGALSMVARRRGGGELQRLLAIAGEGGAEVITAGLLLGLESLVAREDPPADALISRAIAKTGADRLADEAMLRGRSGDRAGRTATDAWVEVLLEAVAKVAE